MNRDYPLEKTRNFLNRAKGAVGRTFAGANVLVGIIKIGFGTKLYE